MDHKEYTIDNILKLAENTYTGMVENNKWSGSTANPNAFWSESTCWVCENSVNILWDWTDKWWYFGCGNGVGCVGRGGWSS